MYVILIVWLIFIIGGAIASYLDYEGIGVGAMCGALMGLLVAWLIGGIISIAIFGSAPMECKYTQDLIAMKDTTSTSASFFLGCGHINSTPYYVYMAESEKGIRQYRVKQESNEVYIKYTDGQPYMEYWDKEDDPWRVVGDDVPYYVFYLPQGSVVETYEIDME